MGIVRYLWGPHSRLAAAAAFGVFIVDRLHKWYMLEVFGIAVYGPIEITPFFDLLLVWNYGISYGLFQQETDAGRLALVALNIVVALALWVWLVRSDARLPALSLALIIGGAVSNAVDRLLYGAVADFFHFHAFGWSWYVFNIADAAIVAGVAGVLYDSLRGHKSAPKRD